MGVAIPGGARARFVPVPVAGRVAAAAYVLLEAALGAIAFSSDQARPAVEWAAFLLLLPTVVLALPLVYGLGALAWGLRDALPGRPMWPVTTTFAVLLAGVAVANVLVLWLLWSRRRGRSSSVLGRRGDFIAGRPPSEFH